nr:MAG TPA: hypothetical protein [Bacteriophage sp.]
MNLKEPINYSIRQVLNTEVLNLVNKTLIFCYLLLLLLELSQELV